MSNGAWHPGLRESYLFDRNVIAEIQRASREGFYDIRGFGAKRRVPHFDDLLFLGASVSRYPLEGYRERCGTDVVLGTRFARRPIELKIPITIAGMSFGALSAPAKEALGRAATEVGTATTTGDGGMTEEERQSSKTLVYQLLPSRYGMSPDHLRRADAIEIVVGQGDSLFPPQQIGTAVQPTTATLGNLVQADQTVLTSVVSQDPVYVYFQPDEQSFLRYRELARKGERANSDNPVRVGLASETGFPHSGMVNFVNNQVDAATGTINVRATVPNPDGVFVPGLYARVQLEGRAEYMAMLIDDKAIMTDQDRKYVYVLGPEDKVKRKDIVLGSVHDGLRVVQSGLDANDKVIVAGFQKIFAPDTKVKPNLVAMSTGPSPNP